MDIRKFFSPTNTSKKGAAEKFTSISSKEEVNRKSNSKKRRLVVIDSDSDEEPIPTKKTQKNGKPEIPEPAKKDLENGACNSSPPKTKLNFGALKKHKPEAKSLKPLKPDDFFHSPPKNIVKVKVESKKDEEYEIVDDDDDDFQKTLKQLDKKKSHTSEKSKRDNSVSSEKNETSLNGDFTVTKTKKESERSEASHKTNDVKVKFEKDSDESVPSRSVIKNASTIDKKGVLKKPKKSPTCAEKMPDRTETILTQSDVKTSVSKEKMGSPMEKKITPKSPEKSNKSSKEVNKPEVKSPPKVESTPETKRNPLNYRNYMQREGPQALGSKEVPDGKDNCLQGLTFVITGVLESFERDEMKDLVVQYGGKVMSNISKTTKFMVVGRDAGPAKLEKAEKFGTKLLTEDELLEMIRTLPGKSTSPKTKASIEPKTKSFSSKIKEEPVEFEDVKTSELVGTKNTDIGSSLMWVDKHKPTSMKQIIGQQGDRSCAKKLLDWLHNWWKNNSSDKKAQKKWNAREDGSLFKASLLSGPPGVGKTTTAQLICKELGFQYIELNASDTRSKKSLQTQVAELLQNQTISASLSGKQLVQRHAIIFDEVDGMSGNEDRGGTQELIALIRHSKIPVICICNDRQHPKIRSLANYCFDLRFLRPRVEQIKAAMMSLLHKEKVKVPPETLQEIITSSNQDLRQVLHHLSFLSSKDVSESRGLKTAVKDVRLSPFDVLKKVFAPEEAKATINDKASLFFHDYSLAPLFVQENYAAVKPLSARSDVHKHLDLLSRAAESLSYSDTIDRCIRSQNNWSLLPTQAIFASVIPGECMRGYLSQMILFPSWLGKNSSRNHMDRIVQQIHMHTRLRVSGNKTELALDYLSHLRRNLTEPLIEYGTDGVKNALDVMENYYLLREDLDSIVELTQWPGQKDPMTSIEPKTKAALTRALNKDGHKNPYATVSVKKSKKRSSDTSFDADEEGVVESEEEDDDTKLDAMVKQKKAPANKISKYDSEDQGPSTKGKGRGKSSTSSRGRGRGKK